jgi:hypothetical protein
MSLRAAEAWLLALADAGGVSRALPAKPLSAEGWAGAFGLAQYHGVLPAVTANLKRLMREHGAERVVAASRATTDGRGTFEVALAGAEESLVRQAGLSLVLRRQQKRIMEALAGRALLAFVLKGAAVADRLYAEPGLRQFTDLDLLAREDAVPEVEAALEGLGYLPVPAPRRKYATGYGERTWRPLEGPGGSVEVHWNLVNSPALRRRVSVAYDDLQLEGGAEAGCAAPVPSASSLLMIAAVHGAAGHRFDRLQILCDICQCARGAAGALDEAWLADAAARTGSARALKTALALAGEAFSEPRCHELLGRLGWAGPTGVWGRLLTPAVVLRSDRPLAKLRRQLFRELLKRR